MDLNIEFSKRSDRDLYELEAYIASSDPVAAGKVVGRILQSIRYLSRFPRLDRVGIGKTVRELVIPGLPYRVIYRLETQRVLILRILHTSRQRP